MNYLQLQYIYSIVLGAWDILVYATSEQSTSTPAEEEFSLEISP